MQNPQATAPDPFQRIKDLVVQTKRVTAISNDDQEKLVVEYGGQLRAAWKIIEDMRVAAKAPLLLRTKQIDTEHKAAQAPADAEMARLTAIWQAWKAQQRAQAEAEAARTRKAQEDAALAEAKRLADAGDKAGAQHVLEEAAAAAVVQPVFQNVTRTAVGTQYERDHWVCEVIEPNKVPKKFWSIDPAKLDAAVKGGLRDGKDKPGIPGCRIINRPIAARR